MGVDITTHLSPQRDWELAGDTVKAMAFGEMVKLAISSGLTSWHSDLFHDARWINERLTGQDEVTFFYSLAPDGGTQPTHDRQIAEMHAGRQGDLWVITVRKVARGDRAGWSMTMSLDETWRGIQQGEERQ
ncbi:MAG: hypothetical protein GWN07_25955 [Actinobacteria bacterium]|nr:hypothetical protein [Actinomycetota bacterium]NIS34028.1 hypothetical protein [Actinomycetota bacterium]NIU68834.1 hypothetical protein [Actinomycetota bacterium]NIW30683.1 hypothetical protein [Actinomycetota bacterium]NIX23091.1 hypothetical protein [Actinomycetota bacterium]